tara:strand:- start:306 stop:911 length:606 start_codon:yes stop_codon:yes gene_type:complete
MKIGIVNYGMGNIQSLVGALEYIGEKDIIYTNKYKELMSCDKLFLPGVGSFKEAMKQIKSNSLHKILLEFSDQKPILGICLGMQLMGSLGYENGKSKGLGLVKGDVIKFKINKLKIPHVGFNQVNFDKSSKLFNGIKNNSDFYFTHSYHFVKNEDLVTSTCKYEIQFNSSFEYLNIAGVQFHPELSQTNGLRLLKNFIKLF